VKIVRPGCRRADDEIVRPVMPTLDVGISHSRRRPGSASATAHGPVRIDQEASARTRLNFREWAGLKRLLWATTSGHR